MQRLEARWTIESYIRRQDVNQVVLELAKLDFNRVQSQHQRELGDMTRWWMAMGLTSKLSFARDRLIHSLCCIFTLHQSCKLNQEIEEVSRKRKGRKLRREQRKEWRRG
ncbi:hypothetical protein PTKIN_Ptkin02bG0127100 [Pterospermum kingtungense]